MKTYASIDLPFTNPELDSINWLCSSLQKKLEEDGVPVTLKLVTNDLTNYSFLELAYASKPKCKKSYKGGNNTQLTFFSDLDIHPA